MKNYNNYTKNDYKSLSIEELELADNPTTRVPVCLCLDVSGSMSDNINGLNQSKIDALNEGIATLYDCVKKDGTARYAADISIVTFQSNARVYDKYSNVDSKTNPKLKAYGGTYLGDGLELALKELEERKKSYRDNGIDYYQPWLFVMTDGATADYAKTISIASRLKDMENNKKISVFPIGIGDDADMNLISQLSKRGALRLNQLKFNELFEWLSQSISNVSTSVKGQKVPLPNTSAWMEA